MKRILFYCIFMSIGPFVLRSQSAGTYELSGMVTDIPGIPVSGATVVLKGSGAGIDTTALAAWGVTNDKGSFLIKVVPGSYRLNIRCTGYKEWNGPVQINRTFSLPPVQLEDDVQMLTEIVIKDTPIKFRPDRYIVSLVNSSLAKNLTGVEVLNYLPGVSDLKVNGLAAKVYVNDRELKLSQDELKAYLESIPAGEIASIEVIPVSGVSYSGSSLTSIIKLTLKKLPEGGGRFNAQTSINTGRQRYIPKANATLSYRYKGLSFSSYVSGGTGFTHNTSIVTTVNGSSGTKTEQQVTYVSPWRIYLTAEQSLYYKINNKSSVAGVLSTSNSFPSVYWQTTVTESYYTDMSVDNSYANKIGYVNYKAVLNEKTGSFFLLVAEIASTKTGNTDENKLFTSEEKLLEHRSREVRSDRRAFNMYADLTLNFSERHSLETGAKFINTYYTNTDDHYTANEENWIFDLPASACIEYREDIL